METLRQDDIIDKRLYDMRTVVVGAGGIGSFLVLSLAKMGMDNILVCDPDDVEAHNIPNQLYGENDKGDKKVEALSRLVRRMTGTEVEEYPYRIDHVANQLPEHDLLISAVDSMAARMALFGTRYPKAWFMDGRMGAQMAWVLSVDPKNKEARRYYESKLYTDDEASEEPCTARATVFGGFGISGIMASVARRIAMKDFPPKEVIFDYVTWTLLQS